MAKTIKEYGNWIMLAGFASLLWVLIGHMESFEKYTLDLTLRLLTTLLLFLIAEPLLDRIINSKISNAEIKKLISKNLELIFLLGLFGIVLVALFKGGHIDFSNITIQKRGVFITTLVVLFFKRKTLFKYTKIAFNRTLSFPVATTAFVLFTAAILLAIPTFEFLKTNRSIFVIACLIGNIYVYYSGLRYYIGNKLYKNLLLGLIALFILVEAYFFVDLYATTFYFDSFLVLFCIYVLLFLIGLSRDMVYTLAIGVLILSMVLYVFSFNVAEYLSIIVFYLLCVGISKDLLEKVVYKKIN